jgi:probable phosphoglycerate mutase
MPLPRHFPENSKSAGALGGFTVPTQSNWPCLWLVNWTNGKNGTIWLVRHGESTWNALGLIQGHAEGPTLTEKGREQSADAANGLRDGAVEAIYTSDLERAQETAAFVGSALGLAVRCQPALRERCFGVFEGRPLNSLDSADSGIRDDRVVDASVRPEGGESLDEMYARAGAFVEWLGDQGHGGDVVVVTHGGTIRALRAYCAGVPIQELEWDVVPNGSVWSVRLPAVAQPTKC